MEHCDERMLPPPLIGPLIIQLKASLLDARRPREDAHVGVMVEGAFPRYIDIGRIKRAVL